MAAKRPFRFGLMNERAHAAGAWTEQARRAEGEGYATFLVRDHVVGEPFGDQLAPFAALATAAAVTSRLRVGTMVVDNDFRHPVVLAKEAATLDVLSGGRLELGLGAGWLRTEYEQAGIPFDGPGVRIGRLEESVQVLAGLFGDGPVTFAGRHYRITGLTGFPRPVQRPHPPFMIGGGHPRILKLAGRVADTVGLLTAPVTSGVQVDDPTERLAARTDEKIAWVREGAGPRFADVELSVMVTPVAGESPRAAAEALLRARGWSTVGVDDVLAMPSVLAGSTEDMVEQLEARRERHGLSYIVVADRHLDRFAPVVARLGAT
jgi:probable F420-dependent oxidoreductase